MGWLATQSNSLNLPLRYYLLEQQLGLVNGRRTLYEMLQLKIHPLKLCTAIAIPVAHFQTMYSRRFET